MKASNFQLPTIQQDVVEFMTIVGRMEVMGGETSKIIRP